MPSGWDADGPALYSTSATSFTLDGWWLLAAGWNKQARKKARRERHGAGEDCAGRASHCGPDRTTIVLDGGHCKHHPDFVPAARAPNCSTRL